MEVNKGSTMVLNTIGQGGWEIGNLAGYDWAKEAGIKPDKLVVVCSNRNVRSVRFVEDRMKFEHPTCKFAVVENNNERL